MRSTCRFCTAFSRSKPSTWSVRGASERSRSNIAPCAWFWLCRSCSISKFICFCNLAASCSLPSDCPSSTRSERFCSARCSSRIFSSRECRARAASYSERSCFKCTISRRRPEIVDCNLATSSAVCARVLSKAACRLRMRASWPSTANRSTKASSPPRGAAVGPKCPCPKVATGAGAGTAVGPPRTAWGTTTDNTPPGAGTPTVAQ
mmetsp:Transcript_164933/g.524102  ORF Transcript_164933/g.524102 Transcript_164933/m.524102 type:complete len:206 (+) Transcript_164933:286-903(+)